MKNRDDIQKAVDFIVKNSTLEDVELKSNALVTYRILTDKNFTAFVNEIIRLNKKCKYWSDKYRNLKTKYEPDINKKVF